MKSRFLITLLIIFMILSITTMANAEDLTVEPVKLQLQDQLRTQLQDRLNICDEARDQLQDRLRTRDQDRVCFNDIEGHWAREQIRSAYYWGLANGFPDGSFSPNSHTTGTQSVLMIRQLVRCFEGLEYEGEVVEEIDWDLVPAWAREQLQEKTTMQIAQMSQNYGTEDIDRLQFALMLAKSLKLEKIPPEEAEESFLDQDEIPADDLGYVLALKELRLIGGAGGRFYPNREITRAEVAVILNRVLALADEDVTEAPDEGSTQQEEKSESG